MIAVALAKYLHAQGLLIYEPSRASGDAFIAQLPSSPDAAVAIVPYGGTPLPERGSLPWDEPTLQLLIRGVPDDPIGPHTLARRLYEALQGLHDVTLDEGGADEVYLAMARCLQTDPVHIGSDENRRHRYVVNLACHVRAQTTHRT